MGQLPRSPAPWALKVLAALVAGPIAAVVLFPRQARAEADVFGLGDGSRGAFSPAANGSINAYAVLGSNSLMNSSEWKLGTAVTNDTVNTASNGMLAGELVMAIEMQTPVALTAGSSGQGTAVTLNSTVGHWELARIASITGASPNQVLNLTAPTLTYFDKTVTQVIRIPEYTSVTINTGIALSPPVWNGSIGGVLALLANGAVTLSGTASISGNGVGFRGGTIFHDSDSAYGCTPFDEPATFPPNGGNATDPPDVNTEPIANTQQATSFGIKGEGISGTIYSLTTPPASLKAEGRGNYANGAGGGDCHKSGGGGGGNGGPGGPGGNDTYDNPVGGDGGAALSYSLLSYATFGGGGGAGHEGQNGNGDAGSGGAPGGGIVWMRAGSVALGSGGIGADGNPAANGTVTPGQADENNGNPGPVVLSDGVGGGGAGGTVYLRLTGALSCSAGSAGIHAKGGNGGNSVDLTGPPPAQDNGRVYHGPGGGGGGGQILFQATTTGTCLVTASSGAAGVTSCGGTGCGTSQAGLNQGAGPPTVQGQGTGSGGTSQNPTGGMTIPATPTLNAAAPSNAGTVANCSPDVTPTTCTEPTISGTIAGGASGYASYPSPTTIDVYLNGFVAPGTLTVGTALVAGKAVGTCKTTSVSCTFSFTFTAQLPTGNDSIFATVSVQSIQSAQSNPIVINEETNPTWASVVDIAAEPWGDGVRIRWATDLELDNAGFRLLRADGGGEPEDIGAWVEASGESFTSYSWIDRPLAGGLHSWWIEDLDFAGNVTLHGPVMLDLGGQQPSGGSGGGPVSSAPPDLRWTDPLDPGDVVVLEQDSTGITYQITPPPFTYTAVETVLGPRFQIAIPGYQITDVPGAPALPVRIVEVPVPMGMTGSLVVEQDDEVPVPGLTPTVASDDGENWSLQGLVEGPARIQAVAPAVHFGGGLPPPAVLADQGWMGPQHVVELMVVPLRWNPATSILQEAQSLVVRVNFTPAVMPSLPPQTAAEATQRRLLSGPALKVTASAGGLAQIPLATLTAAGISPSQAAVYRLGAPVPSAIVGGSLVFLAPVTATPWSNASAYWIAPRGEAPLSLGSSSGTAAPASQADLTGFDAHFQQELVFEPMSAQGVGADRWYWTTLMTGGAQTVSLPLTIASPAAVGPARLTVMLQGLYTDPNNAVNHAIDVQFNGTDLGTVSFAAFQRQIFTFTIPAGVLTGGANTLTLDNVSTAVTSVALGWVNLLWTAPAVASGNADLEVTAQTAGRLTAGGFALAPVLAIDETTGTLLPLATLPDGGGAYLAAVSAPAGDKVRFVSPSTTSPSAARHTPLDVLANPSGADYLVIAATDLVGSAQGFATYRATPAGGAFRTATVDVAELYDAYSFGDPNPAAVQRFLERTATEWPLPSPRYLLLAGVSSYDPNGNLGETVPAALLLSGRDDTAVLSAPSDSVTATLGSFDRLPDLAVGRIPASTPAQLSGVLAKVVAYESAPRAGWGERVTLLADDALPGSDVTANFAASLAPSGIAVDHISAAAVGDPAARTQLLSDLAQGVGLTGFIGHGGVQGWGSQPYFSVADAPLLSNRNTPIFAAADCLNAYFDHPLADSLAADLVTPGASGAVGVWTSSAITNEGGHADMFFALEHALWREPGVRLGDAMLRADARIAWRPDAADLIGTFLLMGDPALKPNVHPVPLANPRIASVAGGSALLSGDQSSDGEGNPLDYRWTVVGAPTGATYVLSGNQAVTAGLTTDTPGAYRVRLQVANAWVASPPTGIEVDLGSNATSTGASHGCTAGPVGGDAAAALGALFVGGMMILLRRRGF